MAQARKIIAAFDLPENKDKGVVQLDGRMVERLHADMARDRRIAGDRRRSGASRARRSGGSRMPGDARLEKRQ